MTRLGTGIIELPRGCVLSLATTKGEFLNSPDGKSSKLILQNPPWSRYFVGSMRIDGVEWGLDVHFNHEHLDYVGLQRSEGIHSWEDQAKVDPEMEKQANDAWIGNVLGHPEPWVFDWGYVESAIDWKNMIARICVVYGKRASRTG